jgi:hypothetical protein
MDQASAAPSSPPSPSFAGLLASLASPAKENESSVSSWPDGDSGDDIVTLSYEQALRQHARYRPADRGESHAPDERDEREEGGPSASEPKGKNGALAQSGTASRSMHDHNLRTASVTIRLSSSESAQLRRRATEAGMTISAYLRSCVLEADALRTQVKETLAEMKIAAAAEIPAAPERKPWLGWVGRFTKRK